jgi:hypothetical protein
MEIIFRPGNHQEMYNVLLNRLPEDKRQYAEYKTAMYLISLVETEIPGVADQIFDFKNLAIKPQVLEKAWQTGSTKRTIWLCYNLWNGFYASVWDVFGYSYWDRYYVEAIRIRFESTCTFDEEAFFAKFLKKS